MSIISAGTLLTNALTHTADRTGRLVFQTNGTTTALTLDSSQDATFAGGVTVTGNLTVAGTTTSFGDNDKIVLGDGQDLQIFHNGSASYISDQGDGNLVLQAGDALIVQNSAGTENMVTAYQNGAVSLYYDNNVKLATTNTGVSVTGDISVTGQISGNVGLTPQVITTNTTGSAGNYYFLNSAGLTLTLPASPSVGDTVGFSDVANDATHTIGRNGNNIMGSAADMTVDTAYQNFTLMYTGATVGWAFAR